MIDSNQNPVEWPLLLYELADAEEHLHNLINQMNKAGRIDDEDYRVQIGHIYSHLNQAWNSRSRKGEQTEEPFESETRFPSDIKPI